MSLFIQNDLISLQTYYICHNIVCNILLMYVLQIIGYDLVNL